jgi:UDP-N-acetylglucosamine 2-epimerase (non-hydrolysing)
MKVLTILGTRPEIIRLSRIIPLLDSLCEQTIVHTGQNYDFQLDGLFFEQLGVRQADHYLGARGSFGEQMGKIMTGCEQLMSDLRPDRFLVLGDTNSSLGAIMAKRLGIPVFHMEAGNRCYDDRVPEEVNRRIIDHSSDILMPYTERSRQNLLREGIEGERIYVTGNPIFEVLQHYDAQVAQSRILSSLGIQAQQFFLVTLHRAETVDVPERLADALRGLKGLVDEYKLPIVISTHPRTKARLETLADRPTDEQLRFLPPFGFFDFVALQKAARCVLSDSGTVQEECSIMRIANVTLRDTTERPETIECGSNILSGVTPEGIQRAVRLALASEGKWSPPPEYLAPRVSETVARIVLGHWRPA